MTIFIFYSYQKKIMLPLTKLKQEHILIQKERRDFNSILVNEVNQDYSMAFIKEHFKETVSQEDQELKETYKLLHKCQEKLEGCNQKIAGLMTKSEKIMKVAIEAKIKQLNNRE